MVVTYSASLPTIPLTFERYRAGVRVTGLTVTVVVVNNATGATLLASTTVPEVASGSGIYRYNWAHGLVTTTEVTATYTVAGYGYPQLITITADPLPGRAV